MGIWLLLLMTMRLIFSLHKQTYTARLRLQHAAQTAYFVAVVEAQWMTLLCSKTRLASLWTHGVLRNRQILYALVFETALAVALVYIPGTDDVFRTEPLAARYWLPALTVCLLELVVEELRKYAIRRSRVRHPDAPGFLERETFY
jgi:sodium/potassium-transporting ATPase subunit alpha